MSLDFVNQHVFLIYIETAQNSHEECNEFADLLFWRLSLCLSRDSLSCDTRSLDLCSLFKFIFLYLWYVPPHSCAFHAFYFTPNISYVYITTWNIFLIPDDAVAWNLINISNFRSQRPHLNYIYIKACVQNKGQLCASSACVSGYVLSNKEQN